MVAKLNQIFRLKPDVNFIEIFVKCYGLENLCDENIFCYATLDKNNTIGKVEVLLPELLLYYYPHKAYRYLNNINNQRCITILRHFLKVINMKLEKIEKVINKKKKIYYKLSKTNKKISVNNKPRIVVFD